jgi:murein DD-endopeptidase MepM/ murein hydrolase activator NlpD
MMEGDNDRALTRAAIAIRFGAVLAAILVTVSGCARNGPPAPVDDRSHTYYDTRPNSSAARSQQTVTAAPEPVTAAPRTSAITSAPLDAVPSPPTQPQSRPQTQVTQAAPSPTVAEAPSGPSEITVQVAPGQTLYAISRAHNVPVRALIELNNLDPPYALRTGQSIRVPNLPTYLVAEGDTLNSVSRRYGVGVSALAQTNRLEPPYRIVPGSRLLIPRADGASPAVATATVTPQEHVLNLPPGMEEPKAVIETSEAPPATSGEHVLMLPPGMTDPGTQPQPQASPASLPTAPSKPSGLAPSRRGFLWPVQGEIASGFGPKPGGTQNDGVNIIARRGTDVRAAEDGVVVYAGNELRGYGNLLLIRHTGGWMTAYAHNDELLVGRGAAIKRGQVIAKVGGTGGVSSPQLHFEVRQAGRPVDPMQVMGPMRS